MEMRATAGKEMGGKDDLAHTVRRAPGGAPRPAANSEFRWKSNGREFVTSRDVAVPPMAFARGTRTRVAESVRSEVLTPGCLRLWDSALRLAAAGISHSGLCLLMNLILPGSRSIWTRPAIILQSHACTAVTSTPNKSLIFRGFRCGQFTNRRILIFMATPSARNVKSTEDPP